MPLVYKGTTRRCHPTQKFPAGWDITHSKKHWSNESRLQPLDVAVNKSAKEFYRKKFQEWYSRKVSQQIEELDGLVMALQPVNMGLSLMRELWIV